MRGIICLWLPVPNIAAVAMSLIILVQTGDSTPLDPLNDIVPLDQDDCFALDETTTTQAILFLDQKIEKVGKAESLGTTIYLQIP